jgi:hypothetical protein
MVRKMVVDLHRHANAKAAALPTNFLTIAASLASARRAWLNWF